MKKAGLEIIKGFLAALLNILPILFCVCILYSGILKQEPVWWKYAVISILPCLFFLIRYLDIQKAGFFLLHVLLMTGCFFFANTLDVKIVFSFIVIIFFILSIYTKVVKKQPEEMILFPAMTFLFAFISYFTTASTFGEKGYQKIVMLTITYVILYFSYQYLNGFLDYLRNNEVSTKNIPRKSIFLTGVSAMAGFLVLFLGMAFLLARGNYFAGGLSKIKERIKQFFIWLLGFAPEGMESGTALEETAEEIEYLENFAQDTENVTHLPESVIKAIDYFVTIGAYVICMTAILLVSVMVIKAVCAAFREKKEKTKDNELAPKDKVTKMKRKAGKEKVKKELQQFSKEKKIRKLYVDLIIKKNVVKDKQERKAKLKGLKYQTPKEQCSQLERKNNICSLYEKARYSGKEVTKDDVKRMKEYCLAEGKNSPL